jgi:hypothetical protein
MNFVGHVAVGLAVGDRPGGSHYLLGAALPDFAAMARLKLARTHGPLGAGMDLHRATDAVFHSQSWFLDLERELRIELVGAGMARGGALACGHVGVELLLDGVLMGQTETARAVSGVLAAAGDPDADVLALVPVLERSRWRTHLAAIARRLEPSRYSDPGFVAGRLHHITASRPRLAFSAAHVPVVVEELARVQPRITASAPRIVQTVAALVATRGLGNT